MPEGPLEATVGRRENARERAKRYGRFLRDATSGLLKVRQRKRDHTAALRVAGEDLAEAQLTIRELRDERREAAEAKDRELVAQFDGRIEAQRKLKEKAEVRVAALSEKVDDENRRIVALKQRAKRALTKRRFWRKRIRMAVVRIRHIKELRKQRREGQPQFEPWMANGADWQNASKGSRAFIARAVVLHGLTCTSMARTYVPAGGSTSSYHLVWNGARAGDAAGSMEAMLKCQRAEFERGEDLTGQLEMFGPANDLNLKQGQQLIQAEGSPNEDLHDSHVHCAEEDSAVSAALQ